MAVLPYFRPILRVLASYHHIPKMPRDPERAWAILYACALEGEVKH